MQLFTKYSQTIPARYDSGNHPFFVKESSSNTSVSSVGVSSHRCGSTVCIMQHKSQQRGVEND